MSNLESCRVCKSSGSTGNLCPRTPKGKYVHVLEYHMERVQDAERLSGNQKWKFFGLPSHLVEQLYPDFHQSPGFQQILKLCYKSFDTSPEDSNIIDLTSAEDEPPNCSSISADQSGTILAPIIAPINAGQATSGSSQGNKGQGPVNPCACGNAIHSTFLCGHSICLKCYTDGHYGDEHTMCRTCREQFNTGKPVNLTLMDVD